MQLLDDLPRYQPWVKEKYHGQQKNFEKEGCLFRPDASRGAKEKLGNLENESMYVMELPEVETMIPEKGDGNHGVWIWTWIWNDGRLVRRRDFHVAFRGGYYRRRFFLVRMLMNQSQNNARTTENTAMEILKQRYARGEISHEEFEKMKQNLS